MGVLALPRCARAALPGLRMLLLGSLLLAPAATEFQLVLLHTNDVHARVEEASGFGGVARRVTEVKRIRQTEPNVLLLDAGDQFQGTVWFSIFNGAEAAHFMNLTGYDVMALGNHEFDKTVDVLLDPFLARVQFPVLSANIKANPPLDSTFGSKVKPSTVLTVGGQKVGVVGYTTTETPIISSPGPYLQFEDEVTAVQREVDILKTQGVNKIIALGHAGFTKDQEIARSVRGVDVVIGGHSDTFLYTGTAPSDEVPEGPYPFMVDGAEGRKVPVIQAYRDGKYLGRLLVKFDNSGNVLEATGNPILLNSSISQDPAVLADVEQWKQTLQNLTTREIGRTLVFLNGTRAECRFRECNIGNFICDAMVDSALGFAEDGEWNHVSASVMNAGGIRNSIDETAKNGTITLEDLLLVVPFGNTFDLVSLNGSTLRKAFEHSVSTYGQSAGEFLQVSGFRVAFNFSRPVQMRVMSLEIVCTRCRVPVFEPVLDDQVYKVLMPSFIAGGGDGYTMIRDERIKHSTGNGDIDVVSAYVTKQRLLHPGIEGRILESSAPSLRCMSAALLPLLAWSLLS